MYMEEKICPCCGRHCNLAIPGCEWGEEYKKTGVLHERGHHHGKGRHQA
ncbi:MAG: hypothetical protein HFH68_06335 [Lachnospiraceae bacterium]|nr:hypothetical protein [Lachnospiraceae bacterium]